MVIYPDDLKVVLAYMEALDAAEKQIEKLSDSAPYASKVQLVGEDGANYGTLQNADGIGWSWETS